MAKRINIQAIIQSQFMRDVPLVMAGCAIAALATDIFLIPNGLAAGGLTGLRPSSPSWAVVPGSTFRSVCRPSL